MLPDKDIGCHRTGFARTCFQCVVEHKCRLWQQIQGHNPNTGEQVSKWGCADEFRNMLLIENSQMQRQTGAAVESFRNAMLADRPVMVMPPAPVPNVTALPRR